jgi:outer membrane murein-binding lipoprotein Lpp
MAPAALTVDGVNLANQLNSSIDSLKSALPSMTDAAAAQAALPKINEATAQLNDLSARVQRLSPDGKTALIKMIVLATPSINQMCDKVLATPGVGPVAKPAIDDLRAKLDSLTKV